MLLVVVHCCDEAAADDDGCCGKEVGIGGGCLAEQKHAMYSSAIVTFELWCLLVVLGPGRSKLCVD
jgi:hypothetical protein